MMWLFYFFVVMVTFFVMEGATWLIHKYIMHGFLWYLHEDHHKKYPGFFEKNDWFFFIFAIPSWLCIMLGFQHEQYWVVCIGAGLALYGFAYFLVHDVIIHQRFKWFTHTNKRYVKVIRWAHKMHHKHLNKEHGESFGFLFVAKKYWEKVKRDEALRNETTKALNTEIFTKNN